MRKNFSFVSVFSVAFNICAGAFLSKAIAQSPSSSVLQVADPKNQVKQIIISCFLLSLFICFIVCLYILLFSQDKDKVNIASDAIKTLTGFFIGSITGYLG